MVSVFINMPVVRRVTGQARFSIEGDSVSEVIANLERLHPGSRSRIIADETTFQGYLMVIARFSGQSEFVVVARPDDDRIGLMDLQFLPISCGG